MIEGANDQQASTNGYDAELRRHNELLRHAADVQPGDHVLDIGCGTGQTTRQAARTAQAGNALGVDVSASAIQRAGELARAEGIRNVTFTCADAQVLRFPQKGFDLAISRFGTMFFGDPVAAFSNICRALRPTGRLVMMVWQARELNEWAVVIRESLEAEGPVTGASAAPDPFSLADRAVVTDILHAAGFTGVTFIDVDEPVYYGPDVAAALDWIRGFTCTSERLDRLGPAAAARAVERLRAALAARLVGRDEVVGRHSAQSAGLPAFGSHALSADGVWFDSRAWIVTAHRR